MSSIQLSSAGLNVGMTLESGQVFRWKKYGPSQVRGVLDRSVVSLCQEPLHFHAQADLHPELLQSKLNRFFYSDKNWAALWNGVDVDPEIHAAILATQGLRILRQDPWECLASFICSSNNNIVRIEGMIERLCRAFGEPISYRGEIFFAFPRSETLSRIEPQELRKLGFGYRAPYLVETARQVDSGEIDLAAIARMPYTEAREALLQVYGVGEKVVECALLFGFGHFDAFPVDVWITREMCRLYFRNRKVPDRKIRTFARRYFGPNCGLAQQALFHAARRKLLS